MTSPLVLAHRPSFMTDLLSLPRDRIPQVLDKAQLLSVDPHPDGHAKKKLKHWEGVYRLRSGDYRVFYTFDKTHVSLLKVVKRDDETYDEQLHAELLGAPDVDVARHERVEQPNWEEIFAPPVEESRRLPEPVTKDLLHRLGIPDVLHARLFEVESEDELLACPGVPDDHLLQVHAWMFSSPLKTRLAEPELIAESADDLLRYAEGDLPGFLLRLNPEQEKLVSWALDASGPTLVKGGPGTGKSTVALYRVREMLRMLREAGMSQPRILFTTYTNALVHFSEHLLRTLIGDDAELVEVRTADSVVHEVARARGRLTFAESGQVRSWLNEAIQQVKFDGNALQEAAQRAAIDRLGLDYVQEEIEQVILGRGLAAIEQYLDAGRPGRRVPLNQTQRRAVWAVFVLFDQEVHQSGKTTWARARADAAELVRNRADQSGAYDAVVIDEAQDLAPVALRLLADLAAAPNRLFVTADEHQSIYGNGFRWSDVHEELSFVGRTGILRANHRSTRQITEAARTYLAWGVPDSVPDEQAYVHYGPQPSIRRPNDVEGEADFLARFLRGATREFHLTIGSGAVLVPTKRAGQAVAERLSSRGVQAVFQTSRELDLQSNAVHVLPLKAAKGLEFPIVALGGFHDATYPYAPTGMDDEARRELLLRERRTMFVSMTRAMRALLVLLPEPDGNPLFDGFDELWNRG